MGYYSEGEGRAERVDVEKARAFAARHGERVEARLDEDERCIELRFPFDKWYYEEDFNGSEHGSGIFRDLREALTTEPAVLEFYGEDALYWMVLIAPPGAERPYVDVEMEHRPVWTQVPEEYFGAARRYFGGGER